MSASNAFETKILNHIFNLTAYTPLTTLYLALHTADPGEGGAQNTSEATGTNYARVAITSNNTNWTPSSGGSAIVNAVDINFPTPGSGGWGTVTHWSLGTASSGAGEILFSDALAASQVIAAGNPVSFPAGALTVGAQ